MMRLPISLPAARAALFAAASMGDSCVRPFAPAMRPWRFAMPGSKPKSTGDFATIRGGSTAFA